MPSAMDLPAHLSRALETQTAKVELPGKLSPTILCTENKMPIDTTTAVHHPPEAHLELPTTSWLEYL